MKILLLHQQILLQTEKLRDHHRALMMHTTPVPAAEIENLLQEIRNLYSLTLELNNENAMGLLNEAQFASIENRIQTVAAKQEISEKEKTILPQPVANNNSTIHQQPEIPSDKKRIVADIHERFSGTPTHGGKFSDHQTLGDKIAGNESTKRYSDNIRTPVKDIKAAIGLNEKFQFINQLFQGDAKKYNSFVDEINNSSSVDSAMKVINEISTSNDWESHAASAKSFIDVVERRFA